jgi:serine-type D-Ala-D-Ala carboxypeptidase/endopeptidase
VDKKVKLDDDIRKYLDGSFPNLEFQGQPITIKDLSTHTSGIPSAPDSVDKSESGDPWANFSREQLLGELHLVKLERKPGEQAAYSNSAVGLLGNILEKVYGMSFEKLVEKFINKPAKMKQTKIILSEPETKRFVRGHSKGIVVPPWNLPGVKGAGALRSTTNDLLKYAQWNILARNKAVQMAQKLQWQSPATTFRMGLGWILRSTPSGFQRIDHSGGTGGYRAYCTIYPQLKLGITVMSNNADVEPNLVVDEIYMQIAKNSK